METGRMSEGAGGSPGLSSSLSAKGKSGQFLVENHIAHRSSNNHPERFSASAFYLRFYRDLRAVLKALDRSGKPPPERPFSRPLATLVPEHHAMHDPPR